MVSLRKEVKVGNHVIGDNSPCFIIAEAGGNHNLIFEQALKLIDIASDAGATAVKFSLSRAETQYPPNAGYARYLGAETPIYEIIKKREVPFDWIPDLVRYSRDKKLIFLCSSFDEKTTDVLAENDIEAFKVASYEATHQPLLKHIARKGKPIIMSTGVTSLDELRESVEIIMKEGNNQLILMHCVGAYPAPIEDSNLRVIETLKKEFGCPVGISDHSRNPVIVPICAAALGANIMEKHFTISKLLPGPDHPFALEPQELKMMVESVQMAKKALGSPEKVITPSERELYSFARRSIFTTCSVKKGERLTAANTAVLRCGQHKPVLKPKEYDRLIGSKVKKNLKAYEIIREEDFEK